MAEELLALLHVTSEEEAVVRLRQILAELERLNRLMLYFRKWFPASYADACQEEGDGSL